MAAIYCDSSDIQAAIISILNANEAGEFSSAVDTGDSADSRYSDDMITNARRAAAYRIFEAIGSNPSHPYWADLATKVSVNSGDAIPVCYGEIGVPEILVNSANYRTVTSLGALIDTEPYIYLIGTGHVSGANDLGLTVRLYDAQNVEVFTSTVQAVGTNLGSDVITMVDDSDVTADTLTVILEDPAVGKWVTGLAADPDRIDSYRMNSLDLFSDPLGDVTEQHGSGLASGVQHPLAGRYSTSNGYIKFTGAQCRIPMIQQPADLLAAEEMADTQIPVTLMATCVRLALGLLYKEGDNLARLSGIYSLQGENDLLMIKGGAVKVAPIDVARAVQFGQRYNG